MANGFAAKDATGATVEILSESIIHAGLGITGQAQVMLVADGSAGQNFLFVDSSGRLTVQLQGGANTLAVDTTGAAKVQQKQPGTATQTSVAAAITDVTLLGADTTRLRASIFNDSTAALYVNLGAVASSTAFVVKLAAAAYWETDYTGIIHGTWDTATGNARVCNLAP